MEEIIGGEIDLEAESESLCVCERMNSVLMALVDEERKFAVNYKSSLHFLNFANKSKSKAENVSMILKVCL